MKASEKLVNFPKIHPDTVLDVWRKGAKKKHIKIKARDLQDGDYLQGPKYYYRIEKKPRVHRKEIEAVELEWNDKRLVVSADTLIPALIGGRGLSDPSLSPFYFIDLDYSDTDGGRRTCQLHLLPKIQKFGQEGQRWRFRGGGYDKSKSHAGVTFINFSKTNEWIFSLESSFPLMCGFRGEFQFGDPVGRAYYAFTGTRNSFVPFTQAETGGHLPQFVLDMHDSNIHKVKAKRCVLSEWVAPRLVWDSLTYFSTCPFFMVQKIPLGFPYERMDKEAGLMTIAQKAGEFDIQPVPDPDEEKRQARLRVIQDDIAAMAQNPSIASMQKEVGELVKMVGKMASASRIGFRSAMKCLDEGYDLDE